MATVIKIKNIEEGYQSIITNGKHTIIGDEPIAKSNRKRQYKGRTTTQYRTNTDFLS